MQIRLKCRDSSGAISFPALTLAGYQVPARHYQIVDSTVILEGYSDAVLHHDADELLAVPGGLYRMPTPAEQDAYMQVQQAASMVQEEEIGRPPDEPEPVSELPVKPAPPALKTSRGG